MNDAKNILLVVDDEKRTCDVICFNVGLGATPLMWLSTATRLSARWQHTS